MTRIIWEGIERGTVLREKEEMSLGRRTIAEVISVNEDGSISLDLYKNSSAIGGKTDRLIKDVQREFEVVCLAKDRKDFAKGAII